MSISFDQIAKNAQAHVYINILKQKMQAKFHIPAIFPAI